MHEKLTNIIIKISTREEESIGIAVGMSISQSKSLISMQNTGFVNLLSTIVSSVQLYHIATKEIKERFMKNLKSI